MLLIIILSFANIIPVLFSFIWSRYTGVIVVDLIVHQERFSAGLSRGRAYIGMPDNVVDAWRPLKTEVTF